MAKTNSSEQIKLNVESRPHVVISSDNKKLISKLRENDRLV